MSPYLLTTLLLCCSNIFMTFAWYGHLKGNQNRSLLLVILFSWALALFEYLFQVPANRLGHRVMSAGQLKILQEVITLSVFIPFTVIYLKEKITLDYLWAGLCMGAAVYFIFRGK